MKKVSQKVSFTRDTDREFSPGAAEKKSFTCDLSSKFVSFAVHLNMSNEFSSSSILDIYIYFHRATVIRSEVNRIYAIFNTWNYDQHLTILVVPKLSIFTIFSP